MLVGVDDRWGWELRHWQWPDKSFPKLWVDKMGLATFLNLLFLVMVEVLVCDLSKLSFAGSGAFLSPALHFSLWEACLNWGDLNIPLCCWACQAQRCVLFPTRKVRPLGANLFSEMNPTVCPWCLTDWNSCLCSCAFQYCLNGSLSRKKTIYIYELH